MKQILAIIFYFTLTSVCFAQLSDDFSDGDFTNNPTWSDSTSQFIVNSSKQLQLNNTVAATSYLTTSFMAASIDNFEWQFYVKQTFSPSGSNFGRVYLVSDQADLTQPLNGYYLQFGETGSADAIILFRQNGTTTTQVCRGTDATIAGSFGVRVKVTRDNVGLWSLYTDYAGGTNFGFEKSGTDVSINASSYFGVLCTYTVTNSAKFFYDNISIIAPPPAADTTPPTVVRADTTSSNSISVLFSEALDQPSAESISNYSVNNSMGNPLSALLQGDKKTVKLTFTRNFPNGIQNQLSVSNVKDLVGNIMMPSTLSFLYFKSFPSKNKDIIFTEIFPDPSPQVGLPAQEFIEIFNRGSNPVDLSGWKLSDGASTTTFSSGIIFPQQYWIVCSSMNTGLFAGYGNVIGVPNFPTLNNDGDNLTLRNQNNKTIDSVKYTLDWYHDVDKQEGGWSIEIIDVNNQCSEGENWVVSEDVSGGTPGKQNSVFTNKPDLTGPQLLSVIAQSPTILNLTFNEKLEKDISTASFDLSPSIAISKKYFTDQSLQQITLELSQALAVRELYKINVDNLTDCPGNFIQQDFSQLSFALPEAADSLDLVVNEILFNPRSGGVDFVEVYNNSLKYINLKNWQLGNFENGLATNSKLISTSDLILAPLSYLVFTSDPTILSQHYFQSIQKGLFKTTLPSLPDDAGSIVLVSDRGLVVDHFTYTEKLHSPFVKDREGVSLERISFSELTNDPSNWKSASASSGFATPGFINSNSRSESLINENSVNVDPEIFSPFAPGRDFSKINYKFDQSGMAANVKILDAQGRLIKTLANNETLPYEGFFRWDGDRDDGTRSRVGYYVVWFEIFDANGSSAVFRKRAVIGK
ncbi:MAG: lamin tail domain-containing protein [Bacteroidetes bacterium]|nr:lamin tail domain-containing protein [Bacteroidota bacterium]